MTHTSRQYFLATLIGVLHTAWHGCGHRRRWNLEVHGVLVFHIRFASAVSVLIYDSGTKTAIVRFVFAIRFRPLGILGAENILNSSNFLPQLVRFSLE